ncbi:hypothetical protein PLICRDRAFT_170815 [Plicaturopsis crispa FD-325 SS-3]|nr:hypothetical protein PLICRDRAFT_170815 [Plicaturopsis crispa FD-325 SS-3]
MSIRTDRVRMLVFLKRKEGTSKEEFTHHWLNVHGPLYASLPIVKRNILKYEQIHPDDAQAQALGIASSAHDGVVIIEAESVEKIMEVEQDAEFRRLAAPDNEKFLDTSATQYVSTRYATFLDQ